MVTRNEEIRVIGNPKNAQAFNHFKKKSLIEKCKCPFRLADLMSNDCTIWVSHPLKDKILLCFSFRTLTKTKIGAALNRCMNPV